MKKKAKNSKLLTYAFNRPLIAGFSSSFSFSVLTLKEKSDTRKIQSEFECERRGQKEKSDTHVSLFSFCDLVRSQT